MDDIAVACGFDDSAHGVSQYCAQLEADPLVIASKLEEVPPTE